LLNVICFVPLLPTDTLPKLREVGLSRSCPEAAVDPVPSNVTVMVGFVGSLLVMVKLPVTAPAAVGLKVRDTGADWPALIVLGVVIPVAPNSAPVMAITDMVRSEPPVFEIVRFALPVEPTLTVPN
jgi:hypothetical protein